MSRGSMAKHWCFTANGRDPTDMLGAFIKRLLDSDRKGVNTLYICWGAETGETGNHHWQGYLQLKKRVHRTALVKYFGDEGTKKSSWNWHWEVQARVSTPTQCRNYCFKECGEAFLNEWGVFKMSGRGHRNDIHTLAKDIKNGYTKQMVMDKHPVQLIKLSFPVCSPSHPSE